jgi:hypothetical protein
MTCWAWRTVGLYGRRVGGKANVPVQTLRQWSVRALAILRRCSGAGSRRSKIVRQPTSIGRPAVLHPIRQRWHALDVPVDVEPASGGRG